MPDSDWVYLSIKLIRDSQPEETAESVQESMRSGQDSLILWDLKTQPEITELNKECVLFGTEYNTQCVSVKLINTQLSFTV